MTRRNDLSAAEIRFTLDFSALEAALIDVGHDARALGFILGLGDLNTRPICHGYAHACVCAECVERERLARCPVVAVRQPWELEAA